MLTNLPPAMLTDAVLAILLLLAYCFLVFVCIKSRDEFSDQYRTGWLLLSVPLWAAAIGLVYAWQWGFI